jgi:hypothetical protein
MYNINIFKLSIKVYHVLQSPLSIISYAKNKSFEIICNWWKDIIFYFILKNEAIKIVQNLKGNKKCEHIISIIFKLLGLQSFIYIYI